jgi:peptidoglycan/LPS O-acetylase OafA/YrhL
VVFYHAGLGFPGGYVGVDVFFVISGYLITALILKDLERGSFSMANFWERRIRRIFPALAAMVAVTCVAGWFLLLPEDLAKLGASVIAQSLLVSNFYFWRTTNYFGGANEEKPLLHTWSLAVEEQFYLIFPIALMAFWWAWSRWQKAQADRRSKLGDGTLDAGHATLDSSLATSNSLPATSPDGDQRRGALFWLFTAVALLSFGLSIWGVKAQPFATFFLLPTRAWELLLGSMLAVLPPTVVVRSSALREILCLAGLAGIFIPVFFYGEQTPFPGLAAFPPCLGTAALIWANTSSSRDSQRGWTAKALSWSPMVFIGLISYSLYLWHWPIICFFKFLKASEINSFDKWIIVFLSLGVSVCSWKIVEKPLRIKKSRFLFGSYIIGTISAIIIGAVFYKNSGFPSRYSEDDLIMQKDIVWRGEEYLAENGVDRLIGDLENYKIKNKIDFIIWGDSHGMVVAYGMDKVAKELGLVGLAYVNSGVPPITGIWNPLSPFYSREEVLKKNQDIFDKIISNPVKNLFIVSRWSSICKGRNESEIKNEPAKNPFLPLVTNSSEKSLSYENSRNSLEIELIKMVDKLLKNGKKIYIISQIPEIYDCNNARNFYYYKKYNINFTRTKNNKNINDKRQSESVEILNKTSKLGAIIINSYSNFYDRDNTIKQSGERAFYRDDDHLTQYGVEKLLIPSLHPVFQEISNR